MKLLSATSLLLSSSVVSAGLFRGAGLERDQEKQESAAAFAPAKTGKASTARKAFESELGAQAPPGFFDPLPIGKSIDVSLESSHFGLDFLEQAYY
jgi:hypothetical protein